MKSVLLIIDMINGMEEWVPRKRIKKIVPNIERLISKARKKNVQIIYAIHKPFGKKGTKVYNEICPERNDIKIEKNEYSCFYGTGLDKILKKMKIKKLIITGISTHWCILATALDSHYRKYKTVVVSDSITAPDNRKHQLALEWMKDIINVSIKSSRYVVF